MVTIQVLIVQDLVLLVESRHRQVSVMKSHDMTFFKGQCCYPLEIDNCGICLGNDTSCSTSCKCHDTRDISAPVTSGRELTTAPAVVTTSENQLSDANDGKSKTGAIIGGILGPLLIIGLISLILIVLLRTGTTTPT